MTEELTLLPCPFCGCKDVWHYASIFYVYVECSNCGATLKNSSCRVLYHKDSVPEKLVGVETYEAECLDIKNNDGTITHYPEHGYVGVNAMLSLQAYGVMDRWNRRI